MQQVAKFDLRLKLIESEKWTDVIILIDDKILDLDLSSQDVDP